MGKKIPNAESRHPDEGYLVVDISRLEPGTSLQAPIYDDRADRNVLLLSAGTVVTESVLQKIRSRGINTLRVHRAELARMDAAKQRRELSRGHRLADFDDQVSLDGSWGVSSKSFVHQLERHAGKGYEAQLVQQFRDKFQSSLAQTNEFFERLSAGQRVSDDAAVEVSRASVLQIAKDSELFVSLGLSSNPGTYPMQHSLQSSMLAMSIGTTLGLSMEELTELGAGCLLHDVGMLKIDPKTYESTRVLDPIQFLEITKHPTHTFELVRDIKTLRFGSRMVAYQMHERCNGSGYPRKRKKDQIHYLARIAAVADVFVAMISPRLYRPAYIPYHALEEIIRGARQQLFDADAVRALLHTVSLFPIGSYVETTDGRVGTVVRANGEEYTRPVVELYDPRCSDAASEVVDLSQRPELSIKAPLAELPARDAADAQSNAQTLEDNWD